MNEAADDSSPTPLETKNRFSPTVLLRYVRMRSRRFLALLVTVFQIIGALTSVQAIMETRTSQGAVAWAISLNTFPYLAVPAYWVFGRSKFDRYVEMNRENLASINPLVATFSERAKAENLLVTSETEDEILMKKLLRVPATRGNAVELLIDGAETFPSLFEGIEQAKTYLLLQFYIVRGDTIGLRLKEALLAARARGVRVHFIIDEVGSHDLPETYLDELRAAGVEIVPFNRRSGLTNRFQLNFRNHRKLVIADGRHAWVGGVNIGDEYNNGDKIFTPWRDTMVKISGPAVQTVQFPFLEDWFWAVGDPLELEWDPLADPGGADLPVLAVPTGPADSFETCGLYFHHLISRAERRIWIASPYFVPDEQTIGALKLAALRGVEVRILVPEKTDSRLVDLSSWAYAQPLMRAGVKLYRHQLGFMHQKVILVDDDLATVGSANFDNRSFRLNFELTMEVRDVAFASKVEEMLKSDFGHARLVTAADVENRSFLRRFLVRASNLLAPVQ